MTSSDVLLSAAGRVLEQTNRLLGADKKVAVTFVKDATSNGMAEVPAWTDGINITVNLGLEPLKSSLKRAKFTGKELMFLNGLNYHELAHTMWTPRRGSQLWSLCEQNHRFHAFNVLEDQRAESAMVAKYGPMRSYFSSIVARYLMQKPEQLAYNYPLVYGRKFLPVELRRAFVANSVYSDKKRAEMEQLIDAYCVLDTTDTNQTITAYNIIEAFDDLLRDAQQQGLQIPPSEHGLTHGQAVPAPKPAPKQDATKGEGPGKDGDKDDKEGEGLGKGGDKSGDKDSEEQIPKSDEPVAGRSDNNAGTSTEDHEGSEHYELDSIDEILRKTMEDAQDEVEEELTAQNEAIKNEYGNYRAEAQDWPHSDQAASYYEEQPSTPIETLEEVTREVERELEDLRIEIEEGWDRRTDDGKIDPFRLTRLPQGDLEIFRRWREGIEEALDFEIVLLIDLSGSMSGTKLNRASEAVWVLHKSMTNIGSSVTALGFTNSSHCHSLVNRGDPTPMAPRYYHSGGSTYADKAFEEAGKIVQSSNRTQKLIICLTDGGFSDRPAVLRHVQGMPCGVALIGVGNDVSEWDKQPNVVHTQTVSNAWDLVGFAQNLCVEMAKHYMEGVY